MRRLLLLTTLSLVLALVLAPAAVAHPGHHDATATATPSATAAGKVQYKTATATPTATVAADAQYHQYKATGSATALPATGGASVTSAIALGAGALLVAGGLLARRIIR